MELLHLNKRCKLVLEHDGVLWLNTLLQKGPNFKSLCWRVPFSTMGLVAELAYIMVLICILYGKPPPHTSPFYLGNHIFKFR